MSISLEDANVHPWNQQAWARHLGREVDVESLRSELASGTLVEGFDEAARRYPEKTALTIDDRSATHGDLRTFSLRAAGWLQENGARHGDRVLLCGRNSIDLVLAYIGVLRAGGTAVSCSPGTTAMELERIVGISRPVVAFGDADRLETLRSVPVDVRPKTIAPISIASRTASPEPGHVALASSDAASLAFTSGTTGESKAARLSHANQLATIRGAMMAWRWSPADVLVHALPLSHGHGLGGLHATLLAGSTAIILSSFEPHKLCDAIQEHAATVLFAVPAIYQRLVGTPNFTRVKLSSLRLAISGSAPLSPSLAEKVATVLGALPLERYGTTETGLDISNPYEGERIAGAVGFPLPGVEMATVDEGRVAMGEDAQGEIVLRGPQVFSGYLGKGDEGFLPSGWFRTGDVGHVDPTGYVRITGRKKEMIITGGLNVYPREIELALEEHSLVSESAVVGFPSESWGEEVTAFVVATSAGLDPRELNAFLRQRLAPYKVPKRIFVLGALPRNHLGKVVKPALIEIARQTETPRPA